MLVRYRFVNETVEVEVSEEWGAILAEQDRLEYNNEQKETRRHVSLNMVTQEQGMQFEDGFDLNTYFEQQQLIDAIKRLPESQRNLVWRVFFESGSLADIAREEGVTRTAIFNRLKKALMKMKKVFE